MEVQIGVHEKGKISLSDILRSLKDNQNFRKAGAIASFIGVVRGEAVKGEQVRNIELEAYEEKANEVLQNICKDLRRKEGIVDVQIHHLLGKFEVGDDLVYVLVAGLHRKNIFKVLEEAVNRFKREAPIFKKEYISNEEESSYWISENKDIG